MEVGGDFSPSILPKNAHFFMICTIKNHQPFVFGGSSISIAMVTILRSHCKLGLVMWSDTTWMLRDTLWQDVGSQQGYLLKIFLHCPVVFVVDSTGHL